MREAQQLVVRRRDNAPPRRNSAAAAQLDARDQCEDKVLSQSTLQEVRKH